MRCQHKKHASPKVSTERNAHVCHRCGRQFLGGQGVWTVQDVPIELSNCQAVVMLLACFGSNKGQSVLLQQLV